MLFNRRPQLHFFAIELEYYINDEESIIGVILFDRTDEDYNVLLMSRDPNKQFKPFDSVLDIENIEKARDILKANVSLYTTQNKKTNEFTIPKEGLALFESVVPIDKTASLLFTIGRWQIFRCCKEGYNRDRTPYD